MNLSVRAQHLRSGPTVPAALQRREGTPSRVPAGSWPASWTRRRASRATPCWPTTAEPTVAPPQLPMQTAAPPQTAVGRPQLPPSMLPRHPRMQTKSPRQRIRCARCALPSRLLSKKRHRQYGQHWLPPMVRPNGSPACPPARSNHQRQGAGAAASRSADL